MFNVIIRVLIIYVVVIAVMRLMGKRQIGELEPFELVITIIIADLATIPMAEQTIPLWIGVIPLIAIAVFHFIFTYITKKSPMLRDILNGKPAIVIDPSGIDFKELNKLSISYEELLEALRNLDYFDLTDINYAIIERNGKITVIPKSSSMPATRKDMKLVKPETDVFYCIIENGKPLIKNFKELGMMSDAVLESINKEMSCTTKDIAFCSFSEGGDVYIQKFDDVCRNFKIKVTEKFFTEKKLAEKRDKGEAV